MGKGFSMRGAARVIYILLAVPFAAMLWIGFYDRTEPEIAGVPFFYWYQLLWIALGALLLLPVYLYEEHSRKTGGDDA
jgi:hypothetical protein